MKYTLFYKEDNDFLDILTDPVIKKKIRMKVSFAKHLILGLDDEQSVSYLILKYGDDAVSMSDIVPDRTPKPNIDYIPKKK